jgi:hypothetical protein
MLVPCRAERTAARLRPVAVVLKPLDSVSWNLPKQELQELVASVDCPIGLVHSW